VRRRFIWWRGKEALRQPHHGLLQAIGRDDVARECCGRVDVRDRRTLLHIDRSGQAIVSDHLTERRVILQLQLALTANLNLL